MRPYRTLGFLASWLPLYHPESTIDRRAPGLTLCEHLFFFTSPYTIRLKKQNKDEVERKILTCPHVYIHIYIILPILHNTTDRPRNYCLQTRAYKHTKLQPMPQQCRYNTTSLYAHPTTPTLPYTPYPSLHLQLKTYYPYILSTPLQRK